ncbi:MAG: hypothetical protein IJ410_02770 [Oscillospiraceae bacterium]|nr:hypothetical protein [Oscillospiraceae bacterium]
MFFHLDLLTPYIEVILPLSAIIALMLMLAPFMGRKYVARARYWVWLIIAIRLLLPFDINLTKEPVHLVHATVPDYTIVREDVVEYNKSSQAVVTPDSITEGNRITAPQGENITADSSVKDIIADIPEGAEVTITESGNVIVKNESAKNSIDFSAPVLSQFPVIRFSTVVANIWVYTAILLLIYNCLNYATVRMAFRRNSVHDEKAQYILNTLCREMGIANNLNVYRTSSTGSAMIMGLVSPAIFIPDADFSEDVLEMMLYHELMHYRRKDILYKFVLLMACCMHWYNPLVWMMDRQAQKDIEIACDEDVIRGKNARFKARYSDSIMSMVKINAARRPAFSTGFANDKKTLISRFKNIYDNTVKKSGRPVIALILALCIISTSLISCAPENAEAVKENFEVPRQAMDFIETYCITEYSDEFWTYENFNIGFMHLYRKDMIKPEHTYHYEYEGRTTKDGYYTIPWEQLMDIYQFMFSEEMPAEWWNMGDQVISTNFALDQGEPATELNILSAEEIDENTFTVTVARNIDGIPFHHLQFEMSKETVDVVPEYLMDMFASGEEIWRIKNVVMIENLLNPEPQTIEINSVEDFLAFAEDINSSGYWRKGNTYLLNCDLDLTGVEMEPIGKSSRLNASIYTKNYTDARGGFCGTFDGQGHTISNLEIIYNWETDNDYMGAVGLFSFVDSEAVIKNLTIENANIIPNSDIPQYPRVNNVGILAGYCNGTVENCHVSGNVEGNANVGGMFGHIGDMSTGSGEGRRVNGYVVNCSSDATVTGCQEVAPFAGTIHFAKIVNCTASGTATGYRNPNAGQNAMQSPRRIAGFGGTVICSELEGCHADTNLVLKNTARVVGAFCATRETSSFRDCTYNPVKAGNWEIVGFEHHNGWNGTEDISDVTPKK